MNAVYLKYINEIYEESHHRYSPDCNCNSCLREKIRQYEVIIEAQQNQIKLLTLQKESESYKDILSEDELEELNRIRKLYFKESIVAMEKEWEKETQKITPMQEHERRIHYKYLCFYTITFSPKRFYQHTDKQYKDYIIYHLIRLRQINILFDAYGCFEKHRNGVIHAHVIIKAYQHDIVKKYLNQWFNHDARNRHCIDQKQIDDAIKVMEYINKVQEGKKDRSDHFFKLQKDKIVTQNSYIKCIK